MSSTPGAGGATNWGQLLSGLGGAAAGMYGYQNAGQQTQQGLQAGINTEQGAMNSASGYYGNVMPALQSYWNPSLTAGNSAMNTLGSTLGTNGQPANYSSFYNMPGYQWAVNQGTQAIDRQAAAMGSAYTPNTMDAVGQYVTGTAMQDYNTYINQLLQTGGLGQQAAGALSAGQMGVAKGLTGAQLSTAQNIAGMDAGKGTAGANALTDQMGSLLGSGAFGTLGNYITGAGGLGNVLSNIGSGIGSAASGVGNALSSLFGGGSGASNASSFDASGVGTGAGGASNYLANYSGLSGLNSLSNSGGLNFNSAPSTSSMLNNMSNSAGLGWLSNSGNF